MKQHDARSRRITTLNIMEYYAFALEELSDWWIPPLRQFEETDVTDDDKYQ